MIVLPVSYAFIPIPPITLESIIWFLPSLSARQGLKDFIVQQGLQNQ